MATFNHLAAQKKLPFHADSSGIGWVHVGERPNSKSFEAAKKRGVLIDHRAQQFQDTFFETYDLILTVDEEISEQLILRSPKDKDKIQLATAYSKKYKGQSIPDPYYFSPNGFEDVMEIILDCSEGLLNFLLKKKSD